MTGLPRDYIFILFFSVPLQEVFDGKFFYEHINGKECLLFLIKWKFTCYKYCVINYIFSLTAKILKPGTNPSFMEPQVYVNLGALFKKKEFKIMNTKLGIRLEKSFIQVQGF